MQEKERSPSNLDSLIAMYMRGRGFKREDIVEAIQQLSSIVPLKRKPIKERGTGSAMRNARCPVPSAFPGMLC